MSHVSDPANALGVGFRKLAPALTNCSAIQPPMAISAGSRRAYPEGRVTPSDITYPETRQPGRPLGTARHIRGPRPDAALTIFSAQLIAAGR
jgi:hypothetical protein